MYKFPIGVMLESFHTSIPEALKLAVQAGAAGIQVYATDGELAPQNLSVIKRREFLREVQTHGLRVCAVCGDFGKGFGDAALNPELIEKSKRVLDLAEDWDCDIVTTHIGVVPADNASARYGVMQAACAELAAYADSIGAHFAVETGPETAVTLKSFLDGLHSRGVAVNMDPANFVMVTGDDPVRAVYTLRDYIVHTHAKDGVRLRESDPLAVYGELERTMDEGRDFQETPLGEGGVDFPRYLAALEEVGYRGFLTIEREVKNGADVQQAADYLRGLINGLRPA